MLDTRSATNNRADSTVTQSTRPRVSIRRRSLKWLAPWTVVVAVLLFWQFAVPTGVIPRVKPEYLGTPSGIIQALGELIASGYAGYSLGAHLIASLLRTLTGFAVGALVAVPVGIILGYNERIGSFFLPIFGFLRPIPALAFVPIVVIWLGIGESAKVFVIFMTAFLYIILGAASGVRAVPKSYLQLGRNYRISTRATLFHIILPSAMPTIFVSLRTAMALSWAVVVAAELIAAQKGLGFLINSASQVYAINTVYVGVALIGVVGIIIETLFRVLESRMLHWVGQ